MRAHGTGLLLALLLAACGAPAQPDSLPPPSSTPAPASAPATAPVAAAPAAPAAPATSRITKVLTVVEENHGQSSALSGMPYLASLSRTYGRTTAYRSLTHPSLPNYLAMAGGSTFGVSDDASPARHHLSGRSVFDAAVATGHTAKTYAEAMPSDCDTSPSGRYAVKHNPWAYFSDAPSRSACNRGDVPSGSTNSGALLNDVVRGTLPNVGMVVPDLCHDAHDCSLPTADTWLHGWLPMVMQGPDYRAGRLAIVVTFDENEGGSGNILTTVIAPQLRSRVVTTPLSHLSWCRWMTDLVGAPALRQAASAPSLSRAFGL